jgi:hypothetical protein
MKNKTFMQQTRRERDIKELSKRFTRLKTDFAVLLHYWKIRCRERGTLSKTHAQINSLIKRLEKIEKSTARKLGRKLLIFKDGSSGNNPRYFLALTHNDINRLTQLLRRTRRIGYPHMGKRYFQVTTNEYTQLKNFLKIQRESHNKPWLAKGR